jgi:2-polyprenyl-3-methyl-5-hydroxy-6-metoxy-1,4-benzoquinol methylase
VSDAAAYRPCPACTSDDVKNLSAFARETWQIGACGLCDFVFLRNPVAYTALEEDSAWEVTYEQEDARREEKRGVAKRVAKRLRVLGYKLRGDPMRRYLRLLGPGKILDIGCGGVTRWRDPFEPYGIELSRALAEKSDREMRALGGYCKQGAGAEAIWDFEENQFDSVMMHSFLEHEVQFQNLLTGCFRALKPGGKAFIRVPNFASLNRQISGANWPGFRYPDHVNYFTPTTLRAACEAAGFTFKLANRHKIWLDDNIQALAIKPAHN